MQDKTKKYLDNLIWNLEININTMKFSIETIRKDLSKLRKFHNKVITNL